MKRTPPIPGQPKLLFLLDYDGTLTDFKRHPERSLLSLPNQRMLKKLRSLHPVILVSGRYLRSLAVVSGLKGFPMAGTHGFESRNLPGGLKLATQTQEKKYRKETDRLWKALQPLFKEFPGIHIENKPYSSTLHYRGFPLSPSRTRDLRARFFQLFNGAVDRRHWSLMEGKMMIEAMPRGFNKGKAVRKILKHFKGYVPIYVGDDITDLSVFRVLGRNGYRVAVGKRIPSKHCDLRLGNPRQLLKWLRSFTMAS